MKTKKITTLPDTHNKGTNGKEKCIDSNENKIRKIINVRLGENLDTCYLYCMFSFFFFFLFFFLQNGL